jgi:hypothetical protein
VRLRGGLRLQVVWRVTCVCGGVAGGGGGEGLGCRLQCYRVQQQALRVVLLMCLLW